jgi:hypothetical protein
VAGAAGSAGSVAEATRARWRRVTQRSPSLGKLVDLAVYEDAVLADATQASALTHGLEGEPDAAPACYFGDAPLNDYSELRERPGLYRPLDGWVQLGGAERRLPTRTYDAQERRIAGWLELSVWWKNAAAACLDQAARHVPFLCVKLVAEPARVWLWLVHGEEVARRTDALARASELLPEEEPAFLKALALLHALPRSPRPPLREALGALLRLSERIADEIARGLADYRTTEVELVYGDGPLCVPEHVEKASLLPLADWRARAWPQLPDETLRLVDADPTDPGVVADAAQAPASGPQAAVRARGLLILPSVTRWELRGVQCPATDPVSFAVTDGRTTASFPDVAGWSARDSAVRAVAEHRAWLVDGRDRATPTAREWPDPADKAAPASVRAVGRLFTAARAALFLESLDAGAPRLALTAAATRDCLAARDPGVDGIVSDAFVAYWTARRGGPAPPTRVLTAFRESVARLPAYARDPALRTAAVE